MQYKATAVSGYYAPLLTGVWPSALMAHQVAVASTDQRSIAINRELVGNVYKIAEGKFSWTFPAQGEAASAIPDPTAIPPGTTFAGIYHDHGAYDPNYDNERFSPMGCNGGLPCDIGLGLFHNQGQLLSLGTPEGRIEIFDPSQFAVLPNGCVLSGSAVPAGPGDYPAVPTCH